MGRPYHEVNFIVAHLGTGVSVTPHKNGRMVDVSTGKDEGAFSPDRCGGLPLSQIVRLCYSGKYTQKEVQQIIFGKGGIYAYLGTKDIREAEAMAAGGNEQAELVLEALAYQVAKEIGAMAAVLEGHIDRIILTGGIAHSTRIVDAIIRRVKFLAQVTVVPGEEELESLAFGALRVLRGEEEAKEY
ncbi:Butyrate kinase 2 [bioreactor metagenome]|uniref:Butyrate kinase 2 n=1 Tax=bioreactor metagenome TaxID=1076179 RepID=A0A645EW30_9ZZZZ